jgi:hypothetical protein
VIRRKVKRQHRAHLWLAIHRHHALCDASHRQNRSLRRIDDGAELVNTKHTQVADGEGATLKFIHPQLASLRPRHQIGAGHCNLFQPQAVSILDHRHEQSIFDRHRQPNMHTFVGNNAPIDPRGIDTRMGAQRVCHQFHE